MKVIIFVTPSNIGGQNMCIIERNTRNISVRLSNARWNWLMELENAYRIAKMVVRTKKECEKVKGMTKEEAMNFIDSLWLKKSNSQRTSNGHSNDWKTLLFFTISYFIILYQIHVI